MGLDLMAVGSVSCLKWIILKAINENPITEMAPMADTVLGHHPTLCQPKYTLATVPGPY